MMRTYEAESKKARSGLEMGSRGDAKSDAASDSLQVFDTKIVNWVVSELEACREEYIKQYWHGKFNYEYLQNIVSCLNELFFTDQNKTQLKQVDSTLNALFAELEKVKSLSQNKEESFILDGNRKKVWDVAERVKKRLFTYLREIHPDFVEELKNKQKRAEKDIKDNESTIRWNRVKMLCCIPWCPVQSVLTLFNCFGFGRSICRDKDPDEGTYRCADDWCAPACISDDKWYAVKNGDVKDMVQDADEQPHCMQLCCAPAFSIQLFSTLNDRLKENNENLRYPPVAQRMEP